MLVGDAFATSCPAAGTGARKVLVDVERLCNVHIPRWLATPGMGEAKIAAFYDDPVKQACDALMRRRRHSRLRSYSTDTSDVLGRATLGEIHCALGPRPRWGGSAMPASSRRRLDDEAQVETPPWARSTPAHK